MKTLTFCLTFAWPFLCCILTQFLFNLCRWQFLRCREAWLSGILDDLDQRNVYDYLKGMINCHRMHLFDVVNQYRAIFNNDKSGSEENYDGGLLFSWAMHQIENHLSTLEVMLPKITEGGSLSNILDQCMVRLSNTFTLHLPSFGYPLHDSKKYYLLFKLLVNSTIIPFMQHFLLPCKYYGKLLSINLLKCVILPSFGWLNWDSVVKLSQYNAVPLGTV